MIPCPCLNDAGLPPYLVKAKRLRLETDVLLNVVKEAQHGVREELACRINGPGCSNCSQELLQKKRLQFRLT